jgi:hypothetical protein
MTAARFHNTREAAMAVLTSGAPLRRNEGQFLGGIAFDTGPLTEKQIRWLDILIDRYGVEPPAFAHAYATGSIQ